MTFAFAILAFSLVDFTLNTDRDVKDEFTYNLLVWYIGGLSLIAWICVGIYFKIMIKLRSTGLFNLILLTILSNISITVGTLVPQVLYYFNKTYKDSPNISLLFDCINSSLGIFEFIVLILNKKSIRLIKNALIKCKNKLRKNYSLNKSRQHSREISPFTILTEINESRHSFSDGGFLCYLFDQVTKEVVII